MSAEHATDSPHVGSEGDGAELATVIESALPQKKKQKRNKPTLSCEDCVERKTKVIEYLCMCCTSMRTRSDHCTSAIGYDLRV
jgi:hypothetical protein